MQNLINSLSVFLQKVFSAEVPRESPLKFSRNVFSAGTDRDCFFFLRYKQEKALLISLKYGDDAKIARIAKPLYEALTELRNEIRADRDERVLVVPLPLSRLRLLRRGFNQSLRILEGMIRYDKERFFYLEKRNLVKIRETRKQALLSNVERRIAQRGAFKVRRPERLKNKTVFLFDDIVTTCASLHEAKKTLLKAGARSVVCIALAH